MQTDRDSANALPEPGIHDLIKKLIEEALQEGILSVRIRDLTGDAVLLAGRQPGKIWEELTGQDKEPDNHLDWKTVLQMFVAQDRRPQHTYSRPNRRFPKMIGIIPGRTYSIRQTEKPHILAAIDTSGSMQRYAWPVVLRKMQETLELYPKVRGIQVMNDLGEYMFPQYRGRWIPDSPARRPKKVPSPRERPLL